MIAQRSTAQAHLEYAARINAIDEATIAWFGGWLCADGSIKEHSEGRPALTFKLTDRDPLDQFSALFGNVVSGPFAASGLGKKPRYEWQVSGWKAAVILERVRPWLSIRYAERAAVVSQWQPRGHAGRKLTPTDVETIRAELRSGVHGTGRKLARQFGVSDRMISAIRHGKAWTN